MLVLFEKELRKGTGIPLILLQKNIIDQNEQIDGIIIENILTNKSYDPQCEGSRADYLYELLLSYK
ncbi:MAG: hypothetical protein LBU25_06865, partial [Treponema sp.]|nr:hypothetical protein [Treponema sp.]